MPFTLPRLPYKQDALAPFISKKTMSLHYGKHHRGYVRQANTLVAGKTLDHMELEKAVIMSRKDGVSQTSNSIGQIYNHNMFWLSMKRHGGGAPKGALRARVIKDFRSVAGFKKKFINAGIEHFGSGWVWLVSRAGKLAIVTTANAETPLRNGDKPLIVCDVWEHAYYLDYKNRRFKFLEVFMENLVNWDFAMKNYP